ncbi:MAG: sporulation initiation factor Spo0A C-terminal domain-containing protein [Oscillospiraceae bacterium]|jgi:two-component system response regulator (stage 0 sporulation protein A)|nr:sporulation initiation factor Spo0A C-terminal domain-containing protein [Oscillospiraceae bacterium]
MEREIYKIEVAATEIITELGIPAKIKGYRYIREAVILKVCDRMLPMHAVYEHIAGKFGVSEKSVLQAVRNAIKSAWGRGNPEVRKKLFGYDISNMLGCPSNAEFIAQIADTIRLAIEP